MMELMEVCIQCKQTNKKNIHCYGIFDTLTWDIILLVILIM